MKSMNTNSAYRLLDLNVFAYDPRLAYRLKQYSSSTILIWLVITFYHYFPYYRHFLSGNVQEILLVMAITYSILALPVYLLLPINRLHNSRGYILFKSIRPLTKSFYNALKTIAHAQKPKLYLSSIDKYNLIFIVIKLFFLPMMLNFLIINYYSVYTVAPSLISGGLSQFLTINTFNTVIFPLLLSGFLLIDTAFFTLGYATESRYLGNRLKSVDSTWLGWLVVLVCYPPFNGTSIKYLHWYASNSISFTTVNLTFIANLAVVLLVGVYASASVALGFKASNLTNRGIVSRGPYSLIRHPAYSAKNLAWWLSIIPVFSFKAALSMALWSFIYFMRAITEERHLNKYSDYQRYCKKVKYRFIPGVL
jgi:protein-S-isoprenylcysteine O-methyltransferase Ste14